MVKIRIGNDVKMNWMLLNDGQPYLVKPNSEVRLLDVHGRPVPIETEINENIVTIIYRGKHQYSFGKYSLVLVENDGQNEMVTVDYMGAFELTKHSNYPEVEKGDNLIFEIPSLTSYVDKGYNMPIATPDVAGAVKPVAKTDEMIQAVGVDAEGRLFTNEGGKYELPIANDTTLGGVKVVPMTPKMTIEIGADAGGHLYGDTSELVGQKDGSGEIFNNDNNEAKGYCSHAEGFANKTMASHSHVEGRENEIKYEAQISHVEGGYNCAYVVNAHVEGTYNKGKGEYSHVEGKDNITTNDSEHAEGRHNLSHTDENGNYAYCTISSIGIGGDDRDWSPGVHRNAREVMQNGDIYVLGVGNYNGRDFKTAKTLQTVINDKLSATELDEKGYTTLAEVQSQNYTTLDVVKQQNYTTLDVVNQQGFLKEVPVETNDRITALETALTGAEETATNINTLIG